MIRLFDFIDNIRLRKKNIYFQYSEEEVFTGEYWIDGKKIFQKTILTGSQSANASFSISLSGIDRIWFDMSNSFYIESGGNAGNIWPINGNFGDANANGYTISGRGPYYQPYYKKLYWNVPKSGCSEAYITFRYTKINN